jgi:hypothetical protein
LQAVGVDFFRETVGHQGAGIAQQFFNGFPRTVENPQVFRRYNRGNVGFGYRIPYLRLFFFLAKLGEILVRFGGLQPYNVRSVEYELVYRYASAYVVIGAELGIYEARISDLGLLGGKQFRFYKGSQNSRRDKVRNNGNGNIQKMLE